MEGFATGFHLEGRSKPGFSLENENFKMTFKGVFCDERKNNVSHGFECCYNWSKVMEMVLDATNEYDSMAEVEDKTEEALKSWLTTFEGWGLLSSMLSTDKHRYFILSLAYASANWNEATGGPRTTEKIFDTVKFVYENCPGKEIRHLVPRLGVWFEEIEEEGDLFNERRKSFTVFFNSRWMLEIKFEIEKKRVNTCLLDLAAEAVAKHVEIEEDIDNLEIPATLLDNVYDKFKDAEWVRSYWNFKSNLNNINNIVKEEFEEEYIEEADQIEQVVDSAENEFEEINEQNISDNDIEDQQVFLSNSMLSALSTMLGWGLVYLIMAIVLAFVFF